MSQYISDAKMDEIITDAIRRLPESYTKEPFVAHDWVKLAIEEAYTAGFYAANEGRWYS